MIQWLGLEKLRDRFRGVAQKQVPFATAKALTRVVQIAQADMSLQIRARLKSPTRYATDSIFVTPATKSRLSARINVKDRGITQKGGGKSQADVLGHLFTGGQRIDKNFEQMLRRMGALPAGMQAVPGAGAPLDSNGNIPRGFIVQMLAYFQAFYLAGSATNMTKKSRGAFERRMSRKVAGNVQYFISRGKGNWFGGGSWKHGRSQRLPPGIWQRVTYGGGGSAIKPIIMFVTAGRYRRYFDLPTTTQRALDGNFNQEFNEAMVEAVATAI